MTRRAGSYAGPTERFDMTFDFQIFLYGGIIPVAISIATMVLCRRFLPPAASNRYAAAVGCSIAFFVGYALLPSWAALWPERHWQWLPYLGVVAMIVGPVGLASGVFALERWLLQLTLAIFAAWLLVPTWSRLEPQYAYYVAGTAAALFLLSVVLDPLPKRMSPALLVGLLSAVAACVAITIAASMTEKKGLVTGIAAASLAGCCIGHVWFKDAVVARGLVPVFTIVVGGWAFVGFIDHNPPKPGILFLPMAPILLWTTVWGPIARLRGRTRLAVQAAIVVVPCIIVTCLLAFPQGTGGDGY